MKRSTRIVVSVLICLSMAAFVLAAMLEAGYDITRLGTEDSKGNPVGFNEPVTSEMYGMFLANANWNQFLEKVSWYGGLYVLMHLVGLTLVLRASGASKTTSRRVFFFSQLLLFPFAWVGMLILPFCLFSFSTAGLDGETLAEGLLSVIIKSSWLLISFWLAVFYPKTTEVPSVPNLGAQCL